MRKKLRSWERTQNVLSAGSSDDDLGAHGGHADLHAGVAILGELSGKKLVELGEKHAVSYELHRRKPNTKCERERATVSNMLPKHPAKPWEKPPTAN